MVTEKLKELAALKAKAAALEQEIAGERSKALAALPAQYGFEDPRAFIAAVAAAAGGGGRMVGRRGRKPGRAAAKPVEASGGRKKRAVITNETRAQVKKLVQEGKTGAEIAKALNISLPSVQNIKKALGLVRKN